MTQGLKYHQKLLLLAGLAVVLAPLFGGKILPLYDGVGYPDEPYKYVVAPSFVKNNKQPTLILNQSIQAKDGINNGDISLSSEEQGPQIVLAIRYGTLGTSNSATQITVTSKAAAADRQPRQGVIAGNIYKISATSDGDNVEFKKVSSDSQIQLRLPQEYSPTETDQVIEYRGSSGEWQKLSTSRVGNDIYLASLNGFGDYALINLSGVSQATRNSQREKIAAIIVVVVAIIFVVTVLIAVKQFVIHKKR